MEINSYETLIAHKLQLETIMEGQKKEIQQEYEKLKEHTNPLVVLTQVLTGSFKDAKENKLVNLIQGAFFLYKEWKNVRFSDNKSIFEFITNALGIEVKLNKNKQEKAQG